MSTDQKLTKPQLIRIIARETGLSVRQTRMVVDGSLSIIVDAVAQGKEVMLSGFGSFKRHYRKKRRGINPNTYESVIVPATLTPHFNAGTLFKKRVKQKLNN